MRFFITGIGGFAGAHLADYLLSAGHEVVGSVTGRPHRPRLRALAARHPRFKPDDLVCADVTDQAAVERALAHTAPDGIFHLAAFAFAPSASADAERAFAVNTTGTLHVLEAAAREVPGCRVLVAGSADAYGAVGPDELPVGEGTPLQPVSIYGVSKAAADMGAFQRWWATGQAVIRVRPFNHTGPGQSADFVCSDFARQIALIETGAVPPVLHVGTLGVVRDFSDVRDIVRGYALLWERGAPGEAYNLCSGVGSSIATIVDTLRAAARCRFEVVEQSNRMRGREVPALVGAAHRAEELGWSPQIPLQETLGDLLADWRDQVAPLRR